MTIRQTEGTYADQAFGLVSNILNIQLIYVNHEPKSRTYRFVAHNIARYSSRKIKIR